MKIELQRIDTDYQGGTCLVHARGAKSPEGVMRITMQPLRLTGMDVFYGMQMIESRDDGRIWSDRIPCVHLARKPLGDGIESGFCDATPMYHKKTGTWLLIGSGLRYLNDTYYTEGLRQTLYSVYDEVQKQWQPLQALQLPPEREAAFAFSGNDCGQSWELENGEILVPVGYREVVDGKLKTPGLGRSVVMRCSFDGKTLRCIEEGNTMTIDVPRGLGETSVMGYQGGYYACIRNDVTGYVARSTDGVHYTDLKPLCFDDGTNAGNYNTQQHWIRGGGKLYLVYTRRGLNNDHVFRHRAPLVIAEFDTQNMCVIRATEQIVVPERGARLGNFGCTYVNEEESYVIASEWMQPAGCEKYGSDNSLFVAKLTF